MRHELIAAMLGTAIVISTPAYAQSATTFSYQGTLIEAGTPADGMYEFEVRLLDNLAVQIGLTETPVATVTEGVFQMDLDFGPAAFDGSQRFLEISVRSVMAGGAFTTLSPNHPVTSAPVAQFALEGNEGPVGPLGPQGGTGLTGPQGIQGNTGSNGATGPQGAQGAQGLQGPQGNQGIQGVPGPDGDQGVPGTPGDSHWSINGSNTYRNTGKVGVGTSNPVHAVHVETSGQRAVFGNVISSSGFKYGVWGQSNSPDGRGVNGYASATSGTNYGVRGQTDSVFGVGTYGFAAASTGSGIGIRGHSNSDTGYAGYFSGGKSYFQGKVGFGTTGPSDQLSVNAPAGENAFRVQTDGTTRIRVNALGGVSLGGNNTIVDAGNTYVQGNLGVGNATPTNRVNVESSSSTLDGVRVSNGASNILLAPTRLRFAQNGELNAAGQLNINADSSAVVIEGTSFSSNDVTVGDDLFVSNDIIVSSQLTVGGAKAFTFDINCYGTAAKPGGGSWSVFSDQRLKKNIIPMTGSLDTISALRPVNFEYKSDDHFSYLPGVQRGFIAQEVQQVIPQWVNTAKDGYLYLDQTGYEALIVDAIQELREEKDSQIKQLQTENKILQARLDRIEKALIILSNKN